LSFSFKKGNQMRKLNTEELKQVYGGGGGCGHSASKSKSGGSKSGGSKSGGSKSGSKSKCS
jgi:bacteriocin-like protein